MSQESDYYPVRSNEPELRLQVLKFVGGSTAVTKVALGGPNPITVIYISTGLVDVLFPAATNYVGILGAVFEATTASGVAGYDVSAGIYNTTTHKVRLSIYANSAGTPTLADLAALQWLTITFMIKGAVGV